MAFTYYSPLSINANIGYYSPISINAAQVPSTQTDFPVLVSQTDARFKTVGNGGRVQNASGYDIRPYSDSALTTPLAYELERYNASTGEVIMWVKVASLSSSTTPIYLKYGDSSLTTDASSTTTWSNSFVGVIHLKDGTTLITTDSTATISGSVVGGAVTATAGQIDGGGGFVSASSQQIQYTVGIPALTAVTVSAWVKATSFLNAYNSPIYKSDIGAKHWGILVKSTGKLALYYTATAEVSYDGTGSHTLSTGTWYYLTGTYSSAAGLTGYVNAASDGTAAANGALANAASPTMNIGSDAGVGSRFWNGVIDEVRISSVVRSADWITAEYNNQSAPATFETLGTEVSLTTVPSTQTDFPVLVSQIDARFKTVANSGHVQNSSGFDIRPYSDTAHTSALSYELERYNASTGEVIMWVKVASLSSSTTPIYLFYGDSGLSTDGSSTAAWSNGFLCVHHLKDGTTLNVNSATGTNNGTNHGATAASGKIDGGASFVSASSQYIDCGTATSAQTAITLSAWVNATSFPNAYNTVTGYIAGSGFSFANIYVKSTGKLAVYVGSVSGQVSYDGTGSITLSSGTTYFLTATYDSSAGIKGYVNASADGTAAATGNLASVGSPYYIGQEFRTAGRFWNGMLDEVRMCTVARSANWITTEYNNQNAPGTFETLGTEVTVSGGTNFLPFFQP